MRSGRGPGRSLALLGGGVAFLAARAALAQYGGGMGPGMGPGGMSPGGPAPSGESKEEGPAEEAPEEARPTELEPLPGYANQAKRRTQVIEMDGYFRVRTDWMHNFAMGHGYTSESGGTDSQHGRPPFPLPLECLPEMGSVVQSCGSHNLGSANMRLRLEPTINVTDMVRVSGQFDVLDNTILGSTPDSLAGLNRAYNDRSGVAPLPSLYSSQDPPEIGQNGYLSSVRAKRAWAEVDSEFGSLRFGRMPWHFGRGMAYNNGSCPDCDGGVSVDRIMALTQLYGHQVAMAMDFGGQGQTSGVVKFGALDPSGYPIDLSQKDDVNQYMLAITKIDDPAHLRERIDRGELVANYGLQLVYKSQDWDVASPTTITPDTPPGTVVGSPPVSGSSLCQDSSAMGRSACHAVNAKIFQPDLWFKLAWKALTVEFEGTAVLGHIDNAVPLIAESEADHGLTLRQAGWVLASELRLYHDAFFLGFETGGATGDQAEDRRQYLNYRWKFVQQPSGDHTLSDFKFSPDYHIDEILWRRVMGTVTNAMYFKPQIAYWLDLTDGRKAGLTGSFIYSLPLVAVSTPGNDGRGYGVEMDLGLYYRGTEGFYAGVVWGVLWPLWDLDRPPAVWSTAETGDGSSSSAQVLRTFLGVRF